MKPVRHKPARVTLTKKECDKLATLLQIYKVVPYIGEQPERMLLWASDLESGKYRQRTNALRGERNMRCCLGVACDTAAKEVGGKWKGYSFHIGDKYAHDATFPDQVAAWYGLTLGDPLLLSGNGGRSATELNDDLRLSFRSIAWIIRESVRLGKRVKHHGFLAEERNPNDGGFIW